MMTRQRLRNQAPRLISLLAALGLVLGLGVGTAAQSEAQGSALALGQTAHLKNFDVTVLETRMDPDYYGYVLKVRVCVTKLPHRSADKKVRISWDPWSVTTTTGVQRPLVQEDPPPDTFPKPYRSEARFAVGECATGWLPFWGVKDADQVRSVDYANSLGQRASWTPKASSTNLAVGQKKNFKYVSVQVLQEKSVNTPSAGQWYGVRVKTCVRKLPAGTKTAMRISWDPWSVTTSQGKVPAQMSEGSSPFSPVMAYQQKLKPGQCTTGWLPFYGDPDVRTINYRNSLGNSVSWTSSS